MPVKIEITADNAADAVALGRELFGIVGVTAGATVEAAAPKPRAAKKADEPKPEPMQAPAPVDPFAGSEPATTAPAPAASAPPVASETPATTAAASVEPGLTLDAMKAKLTEVLKAKSAGAAQKAILDATGGAHKALTGLPVEMYAAVHAALDNALKG